MNVYIYVTHNTQNQYQSHKEMQQSKIITRSTVQNLHTPRRIYKPIINWLNRFQRFLVPVYFCKTVGNRVMTDNYFASRSDNNHIHIDYDYIYDINIYIYIYI